MIRFTFQLRLALAAYLILTVIPGQCLSATAPGSSQEYLENGHILWHEPITGMEFVWVEGGCFMMGQSNKEKMELLSESGDENYQKFYSDETPQHEVCLEGFWLARHEVTQRQWLLLMDTSPFAPGGKAGDPAENISWQMADDFIRILSEKSPEVFRLPTEAEWEFAARANSREPFSTGGTINTNQANYNGNHPYGRNGARGIYRAEPLPVGSLPANGFGIFDMHGNLWEWCADWYADDYYGHSPIKSPTGPSSGIQKVMRGGSWFTAARSLRAANRRGINPAHPVQDAGFRLVCLKPPPDMGKIMLDPDF